MSVITQIELLHTLPEAFSGRDVVVSDVWHADLRLERGRKYLIEAASGTGKSSLCSYIYGYRSDYQGIIAFDGRNIRNLTDKEWLEIRRRSLSMLFQELRLFPELTAMENVLLKNRLTGCRSKKEITAWFDALGIGDKADTPTGRLSFGQQQRVAFVRTLCQPSDFIFMDEPVSHIDDGNAAAMEQIITEETKKTGAGVIVTSIGRHLNIEYDKTYRL